jgi:photosystem II stability/assembly factor-like uncharacterized protein
MMKTVFHKSALLGLACACAIGARSAHAATAAAVAVADPMSRTAGMVRAPAKAFLASLAHAGNRLVAVGERGIIVLSDDNGASWRQARVPSSVTLAAVQFPTPSKGWAVGHYGVILHTADGGETWTRQLDGSQAAQLALRDAQGSGNARYLSEAQRLVGDGPDKPFLGLHFTDENNGFAVGAYNLIFRTRDGGKTWAPWLSHLDNPRGNHLYAVHAAGQAVYIAGEQGLLLRSIDGGERFERIDTGYKGSFFAMAVGTGGDVVVAGLRGNAYRSADRGATWQKLEAPIPVSITAATVRPDGSLLMANQAGQLLAGAPNGGPLLPLKTPGLPPLNDLLVQPDGGVVAATIFGAFRLPAAALVPPSASPSSMAAK